MSNEYGPIRQLVERYADAVCRHDAADWGACWATDGEWALGPERSVRGREAIVAFWRQLMAGFPFAVQVIHQGTVLGVDGETARARWYLSEFLETPSGGRQTGIGVYHDDYVREDGAWKFARRRYNLLYSGPGDFSGQTFPFPQGM